MTPKNQVFKRSGEVDVMHREAIDKHISGGSEADFSALFSDAQSQFEKAYHSCRPYSIRALKYFANSTERRQEIIEMALEGMWTAMYRGNEARTKTSTDANVVGVGAAAVLLGRIGGPSLVPDVLEAYGVAHRGHDELDCVATFFAQALANWGYDACPPRLSASQKDLRDSNDARLLYCKWVAEQDKNNPLNYLVGDREASGYQGDSRIYAAAALADMHATDCADDIEAAIPDADALFLRRVMREAVRRLRAEPVSSGERLIWSLGVRTELEPSDIAYHREERMYGIEVDPTDTLEALSAKTEPNDADRRIFFAHISDLIFSENLDGLRNFPLEKVNFSMRDTNKGETLLHKSVANHRLEETTREILLLVLAHTPDVNIAEEYYGDTVTHKLMERPVDSKVLEAFLDRKIDLSAATRSDRTVRNAIEEKIAELDENAQADRKLLRDLITKNELNKKDT